MALALCFAGGCSPKGAMSDGDSDSLPDPVQASVLIGVPSGEDGLDFAPLEADAELRLQTFGQGGTHVLLGVRCTGFGKRAFISLVLENLVTGDEVISPAPVRPQLLYCDDRMVCDLVPMLAMASGLSAPSQERDGLRIEVRAQVRNEAGIEGESSQTAVLSTADL